MTERPGGIAETTAPRFKSPSTNQDRYNPFWDEFPTRTKAKCDCEEHARKGIANHKPIFGHSVRRSLAVRHGRLETIGGPGQKPQLLGFGNRALACQVFSSSGMATKVMARRVSLGVSRRILASDFSISDDQMDRCRPPSSVWMMAQPPPLCPPSIQRL